MTDFYDRALRRISRLTILLSVIGVIAVLLTHGPGAAGGFLLGSALSVVNFLWWKRLASSLDGSGKRPVTGSAILLGSRYLVAAGVIYVIVKIFKIVLGAVFAGLLISFAAVFLEALYELVFLKL